MGRNLSTYGGTQSKVFGNERYFFDSVATNKPLAVESAKRLRATGRNVRIVPITAKHSQYKYRLYVVGKDV